MTKEKSRLLALAAFGAATAGAAWYGAHYSRKGNRGLWYRRLDKPSFTPPDAVFPVVWTVLYAMIAWSGWRIWSAAPSRDRNAALRLWISQLAANAQWYERTPRRSVSTQICLCNPRIRLAKPPTLPYVNRTSLFNAALSYLVYAASSRFDAPK